MILSSGVSDELRDSVDLESWANVTDLPSFEPSVVGSDHASGESDMTGYDPQR